MITDELLFRFLNQETSNKENRIIKDWLSGNPDQANRLNHLKEILESADQIINQEEISSDWNTIESKLQIEQPTLHIQPALSVRLARIAAVLLILVGSGLLWFYQMNTHIVRNKDLYTKSVFLPDGTQVDLGPGSKLVYGSEFLEGIRVIRLTGEACFDVTSDPDHPFTVIAGLAKIKVTGTRFVVNASPRSKEVEVSVKSGNVLFYNSDTMNKNSFRMGLVAGEKGIFYPALNRMDKTRDPYFHSTP
ncbi:MAG: FecR family protein [Bacteroidales bacterium]